MRYIFRHSDRLKQVKTVIDGISEYRERGKSEPQNFEMHQYYDELLSQLAEHFLGHWKDSLAIVGLGGYGRTEMSPYSDIDLLFLLPDDSSEGLYRGIRSLLYMLWDSKVELGHSVRTVDQCEEEAHNDLAVLTSLMDTRLVWGDEAIFERLVRRRADLIATIDPFDLYLRVQSEIRKSFEDFGHTIYLLEPNLKEGPGSLRYIQLVTWLSRILFGCINLDELPSHGFCTSHEVEEVKQGVRFLAEVRTRLHFLTGRRDDRLSFQAQSVMAREMHYVDSVERISAVSFMREYYRHAAALDFFGRRILARTRLSLLPTTGPDFKRLELEDSFYIGAGGINHKSPDTFGEDPKDIFRAFRQVAKTGCDFDIRLVDLIRSCLDKVDKAFVADPQTNQLFVEILQSRGSVAKAVNSMMKTGFLERFMPEFDWVRFLPSYDSIHLYTVDLHTMKVLENIDSFCQPDGDKDDNLLRSICSKIIKPETLYLAGLFHDIGKGRGLGHEVRGEQTARTVLQRLSLPEQDTEDICFLVRNHLAMTHIAFKKDLHDEGMIGRFAENVIRKRRLNLLMLLTHADLRATGPSGFNSWRRMLLEELYYRALDTIQGAAGEDEDLGDWLKEIVAVVRKLVPAELHGPHLDRFIEGTTSRYLLDFYPALIAEHFMSIRNYLDTHNRDSLNFQDVISSKIDHKGPGYSSITLIVRDRPGLFYRIAGTISANRINILGAWSHTIGEDLGIATLHVNDIPEGHLDDPDRWNGFREDFKKVVRGEIDVDFLVASRRGSGRIIGTAGSPRHPVKVDIDNAASDVATIIEVSAHDRPGLLYDITRQIFSYGLNIILTKIATDADRATDIFYVRDGEGKKIVDYQHLDEIKIRLKDHLKAVDEAVLGYQK
jgi:[protein-PII] uridylyltransferase